MSDRIPDPSPARTSGAGADPPSAARAPRARRADGERSRRTILEAAARLATVEGLDGLSIGRLADHLGISKSGLFAHFGSKQELQLATVETARAAFDEQVVAPALAAEPGVARILALADAFFDHLASRYFPGGCFFASAWTELDTRPGPVRDRLSEVERSWSDLLIRLVREAKEARQLPADTDPEQVAFEIAAMLAAANLRFLLRDDEGAFAKARTALRSRLGVTGAERPRRGAGTKRPRTGWPAAPSPSIPRVRPSGPKR